MHNLKINISELSNARTRCLNCGDGYNPTPEEHQEYCNELQSSGGIILEGNFVVPVSCEKCGCNTMHLTGLLKVTFESGDGA